MPKAIIAYVRYVDRASRIVGRFAMYLIFVMLGILMYSSIMKTFFLPVLWTLEMAQFVMVAYYLLGGEADLRVNGTKLKLTTIPDEEWATVEAESLKFWDEIAKTSPRSAKVVAIFKKYNEVMTKAGRPYRYG